MTSTATAPNEGSTGASMTAGPWGPPRRSSVALQFRIADQHGEAIANVWGLDEEAEANARAIAACPDLIEALRAISTLRPAGDVNACKGPRALVEKMELLALAALRKAGHE